LLGFISSAMDHVRSDEPMGQIGKIYKKSQEGF
jgi:hypothetical protein